MLCGLFLIVRAMGALSVRSIHVHLTLQSLYRKESPKVSNEIKLFQLISFFSFMPLRVLINVRL
jgi:hypothetical protein